MSVTVRYYCPFKFRVEACTVLQGLAPCRHGFVTGRTGTIKALSSAITTVEASPQLILYQLVRPKYMHIHSHPEACQMLHTLSAYLSRMARIRTPSAEVGRMCIWTRFKAWRFADCEQDLLTLYVHPSMHLFPVRHHPSRLVILT